MYLAVFYSLQLMSTPDVKVPKGEISLGPISVATAPEGMEDGTNVDPWNVGDNIDYNKLVSHEQNILRSLFLIVLFRIPLSRE